MNPAMKKFLIPFQQHNWHCQSYHQLKLHPPPKILVNHLSTIGSKQYIYVIRYFICNVSIRIMGSIPIIVIRSISIPFLINLVCKIDLLPLCYLDYWTFFPSDFSILSASTCLSLISNRSVLQLTSSPKKVFQHYSFGPSQLVPKNICALYKILFGTLNLKRQLSDKFMRYGGRYESLRLMGPIIKIMQGSRSIKNFFKWTKLM